jgi:hypothetical protein
MKQAGSFLSRFKNLTPPNDAVRQAVAAAVKGVAGVPITKKDVKVVRGVAYVTCSSVAKNAIRRTKIEIFEELQKTLPKARQHVHDIR